MIGSFQLWITNCPANSYAWALRSWDSAAGAWREWQISIPITDNYYVPGIELNGYWCYLRCALSTGGVLEYGPYGSFNLADNGAYTINAQTGAMTGGAGLGKAQIQNVDYPSQATPGSQVQVSVLVKNIGGAEAALEIWGWPLWWGVTPEYQYVPAGGQTTFPVSFAMPESNVEFNIVAGHWDTGIAQWVQDDIKGPFTITVPAVDEGVQALDCNYLIIGPPIANILSVSGIPTSAKTGDKITIEVSVKNVGVVGASDVAPIQPWVRNENIVFSGISPSPFWLWLEPGATGAFRMEFIMPDFTVKFRLVACHWDWDLSTWVIDQRYNDYTVVRTV